MEDIKTTLQEAILSINNITTCFYQQQENKGYKKLNETINIIEDSINKIVSLNIENDNINIDMHSIIEVLNRAMEAMESQDSILLADILQYEMVEEFQKIIDYLL